MKEEIGHNSQVAFHKKTGNLSAKNAITKTLNAQKILTTTKPKIIEIIIFFISFYLSKVLDISLFLLILHKTNMVDYFQTDNHK